MLEHNFTLILRGDVDAHLDELFEAGLQDATIGEVDGVPYAEFDREADNFGDALLSAITDVQSVPEIQVLHVEPDELVTATEIAERLDRTRESVRLLISGARGPGGFPVPASRATGRNRLWRWSDVLRWTQADSTEDADLVAAVNAALELGARSQVLPRERRDAIAGLLVKEQSSWPTPSTLGGKQKDHEGVIADLRSDAHEGQHVPEGRRR